MKRATISMLLISLSSCGQIPPDLATNAPSQYQQRLGIRMFGGQDIATMCREVTSNLPPSWKLADNSQFPRVHSFLNPQNATDTAKSVINSRQQFAPGYTVNYQHRKFMIGKRQHNQVILDFGTRQYLMVDLLQVTGQYVGPISRACLFRIERSPWKR